MSNNSCSLEVSTATIAVSLKKLEKSGYVKRWMDSKDNPYNRNDLTEKGRKVVQDSYRIFYQIDTQMFEGFTEDELETFMMSLDKINRNLVKVCERANVASVQKRY